MSEILTTEAIVLSTINYSDTSKMAILLTKDAGKISVLAKGARSSKNKMGNLLNPLNHLQVVVYIKPNREVQLVTSADLLKHYSNIETDYDVLKYAMAVLELVNQNVQDHEFDDKVFRAVLRILERIDSKSEAASISFMRFFIFLIGLLGYEISTYLCNSCSKKLLPEKTAFLRHLGIVCEDCSLKNVEMNYLSKELFELFTCLKNGKEIKNTNEVNLRETLRMLDGFAKQHLHSYKGLNSLKD